MLLKTKTKAGVRCESPQWMHEGALPLSAEHTRRGVMCCV